MDVAWTDDLDPTGREASPEEEVAQKIAHRVQTHRGRFIGHPQKGIDVAAFIGRNLDDGMIAAAVRGEVADVAGAEDAQIFVERVNARKILLTIRAGAVRISTEEEAP